MLRDPIHDFSNSAAREISQSHFCIFLSSHLKSPKVTTAATSEIMIITMLLTSVQILPRARIAAPEPDMSGIKPSNLKLISSEVRMLVHISSYSLVLSLFSSRYRVGAYPSLSMFLPSQNRSVKRKPMSEPSNIEVD